MTVWAGGGRRRSGSRPSSSRAPVAAGLLAAFAVCASAFQEGPPPDDVARQLRRHLDAGRYDAAETAARVLLPTVGGTTDPTRNTDIGDLFVEALWRNGRADSTTLQLAEDAVARRAKPGQGAGSGPSGNSLANLGHVLLLSGEYSRAVDAFKRSLTVRERSDSTRPALADALDDLARALLLDGRFDEARSLLDRTLQLREAIDANSTGLATTLELSALWYQRKGNYAAARPPLERALVIRDAASADHPARINTLNLLGDQFWFEGATLESARIYRQAVALAERTLRPDHPETALALKNLATAELESGAIAESVALRHRAHAIVERNFGRDHPRVAAYLNDLANGHMAQQDYRAAQALLERALAIRERHLGPTHESVATIAFNLAFLAGELGDLATARHQIRRAASIWEKRLGPEHPFVARAWERLAETLLEHQRSVEALTAAERALAIYQRTLGPDHVDVARTVHQLATIAARSRRTREADALAQRAVGIWEKASPEGPGHATALYAHAEASLAIGNYAAARTMYERALAIRERVYGAAHLDVARALQGLAAALAHLEQFSPAFETALRAETAARTTLRTIVRSLSEQRALQYSDLPPTALDIALSLVDRISSPEDVTRALDHVIRGRGVILDEMAARQQAARSEQNELGSLWAAVVAARQRFANLVVRAPADAKAGQYRVLLEAARRGKEAAERALAEQSAVFRRELERGEVGLDDLRRALPPRSALVSIVRYERTVIGKASPVLPHYASFVLLAGSHEAVVVQLGPAAAIDRAVARWRREAGRGLMKAASAAAAQASYRLAGDRLRALVWDPVASHVADGDRVFVVPDGSLHLVNLAALPGTAGEYLVERGPVVHYLSTERDLIASPDQKSGHGLLALGGPTFDGASAARGQGSTLRSAPCGTLQSMTFEALPGTLQEATEIAGVWKRAGAAAGDVHLSVSGQATERAFKQHAPGRRVLHLATHGFFLGGECEDAAPGTRAVGRVSPARAKPTSHVDVQNPLLVSGLAFAGANQRAGAKPDQEDGILTAEEISAMNLQGTEWAVLSACDTGLGEVKAGEGVFGLRRAFQIAGVRTVIMSLWSVEDEATRQWMRALYEARLNDRLDTAESVRAASLRVLRDRRAKRLSTHPFYWGAFVSAGDWR